MTIAEPNFLPNYGRLDYNNGMQWVRKFLGSLVAFILFMSLLAGAGTFSVNRALAQPARLEGWISESNLYQSFVQTISSQAETTIGSGGQGDLSSSVVAQAAQTAFPVAQLRQDVNTVINSNYNWLKGRTATPDFTIDLTSAKQAFAEQIGAYVQTRLVSLPVCSAVELQQMQSFDPLSSACRPQNLSPVTVGSEISQQIAASSSYLSQPVLTANTAYPGGSQPYYKTLSRAPTAYKISVKLPIIFSGLALLCALLLLVILPSWRRGLRRLAFIMLAASIILLASSFLSISAVSALQQQLFKHSSSGSIQDSLVNVVQRAVVFVTHLDSLIALGFLALAIALYVLLFATRHEKKVDPAPSSEIVEAQPQAAEPAPLPTPEYESEPVPQLTQVPVPKPRKKPGPVPAKFTPLAMDVRRKRTPVPPRLKAKKQVQPRRPRLIQ